MSGDGRSARRDRSTFSGMAIMVVGVLQVELAIDWAQSLKDKRRVVQSIKDRLHREYMVSVAEVDQQDNCRVAWLGIALAAVDAARAHSVLDRVLQRLGNHRDCVLRDHDKQILSGALT